MDELDLDWFQLEFSWIYPNKIIIQSFIRNLILYTLSIIRIRSVILSQTSQFASFFNYFPVFLLSFICLA